MAKQFVITITGDGSDLALAELIEIIQEALEIDFDTVTVEPFTPPEGAIQ
jgi:hypothetical protein